MNDKEREREREREREKSSWAVGYRCAFEVDKWWCMLPAVLRFILCAMYINIIYLYVIH